MEGGREVIIEKEGGMEVISDKERKEVTGDTEDKQWKDETYRVIQIPPVECTHQLPTRDKAGIKIKI